MSDFLFNIFFAVTWQSILLTIGIGVTVIIFGKHLQPRFRYLLWCIVLLRLALPVLPASPWGIWEISGTPQTKITRFGETETFIPETIFPSSEVIAPPVAAISEPAPSFHSVSTNAATSNVVPMTPAVNWKTCVLAIWLVGILVFFMRYLFDELHLYRQSRYWKPIRDPALLKLFEQCRREVGVSQTVALLSVPHGIGAASLGFFRPKILLAEKMVSIDPARLRMVLLHELIHIRRFDPIVLRLGMILNILHWPNPASWFVASCLQRDRELACDAAVLHILGSKNQQGSTAVEYGHTVLAFAELFSVQSRCPGLVGASQENWRKNAIAWRLNMILKHKKSNAFHALFGVMLVLVVAAVGLTKAKENAPSPNPETKTQPAAKTFLKGIVVDSDDKPVSGVVVWARAGLAEPDTTDENGRFQIPCTWQLYSPTPFYAVLPNTDLVACKHLLEIPSGTKELPEIKMVLEKGRRFFGKVIDESGKPVSGAYVGASAGTMTIEPVLTDEQGNFEFYYPKGPTNDIFAIKPGVGFDFLAIETKNNIKITTPLKQENGPLTLTLTKTEPISFHIEDESGHPLEGIEISPGLIYRKDGAMTNFSVNHDSLQARKNNLFFATTDKQGNAVIDWIPKWSGLKKEELNGLAENAMRIIFFAYDTRIEQKDAYGRGTMYWQPGVTKLSAKLSKMVFIECSVRMPDGTPVPWASLACTFHEKGNGWVYTDESGNFSFYLNPHEKISVGVRSSLGAAPTAFGVDAGDGSHPPRIDFVLQEGTKFYGTVLAGPEKKPYRTNLSLHEYAEVSDMKIGVNSSIPVDENGYFETRLLPGEYEVSTWKPVSAGHLRQTDRQKFEITDTTEKRIDFLIPESDSTPEFPEYH